MPSLGEKMENIRKVFDISEVLVQPTTKESVKRYYNVNWLPYSLFHTDTGFIHMGLSPGGEFEEEDLQEAPRMVDERLPQHTERVLELGTGRGANAAFLARRNPAIDFHGIDISEKHVSAAKERAAGLDNYTVEKLDFHNLESFADASFEAVFVVESLCYSTDIAHVLSEVHRILTEGGVFIVFDGYRNTSKSLTNQEKQARNLVEKGMNVEAFTPDDTFKDAAEEAGFIVQEEQKMSNQIMPTLRRFEKQSTLFFRHPFLARGLSKVFPQTFTYNAVSGYLMPDVVERDVLQYMFTVFEK